MFDNIDKLRHTEIPNAGVLYLKLKDCTVLQKDFNIYEF